MKSSPQPENPFLNIAFNILIPVMVLNKGTHWIGPRWSLLAALSFPLVYGIQDYARRRHKNYVSLLGVVNILLTGGLALVSLQGIWFAVKEASLPMLLGVLVLGSAWTSNPAARMMFFNPQVLNIALIEERLTSQNRQSDFERLLKRTTLWLSVSFFLSAAMNFFLAITIFTDIDSALGENQREQILNEQIARMTWMGFAVIALPLMIFSGILVYAFLHRTSKLVEVPLNDLMKT